MVERILNLIKQRGISAKQLTDELELSNSAITDWKKGKARPSTDAIIKIAEYFGVSTDYLLKGTENMPVNDQHLLEHYYKADPGIQKAIDKLLDLEH